MKNIIVAISILLFIASCSKDESSSKPDPTIIAKWYLVKNINWYDNPPFITKDTTIVTTGDYLDFRSDGKEYAYLWSGVQFAHDTLTYNLNGSILTTTNWTGTNTWDILKLTSDSLVIHKQVTDLEAWSYYIK